MAATYSYGSAPTYTKIASNTLSTASTSYTFSNIPQTYTDLVLVTNTRSHTGQASYDVRIYVNLNGDQSSGLYSGTVMHGTGVNAVSYRETARNQVDNSKQTSTQSSGEFAPFIYNIMNYSNPNIFKNVIQRASVSLNTESTYNGPAVAVTLWRNLSPITSLTVQAAGGASSVGFAAGSSFTLYGIKAALVPKATGGDLITTNGTYWYHTFRNSGVFSPGQSLTADYLVIAGGGGGGSRGGGGGAGGLSYFSSQALSGSGYTVTVGSGGAGSTITTNKGTSGNNSQFGSSTASIGGGGGGSSDNRIGANGGSGGGGVVGSAGGTGTAGQGNNGGTNSSTGGEDTSSGGGGAGAAGGNGTTTTAGVGGIGINTYSSWASATSTGVSGYYAGGGGGMGNSVSAAGGTGGGGQGRGGLNGVDGTINTGGGGGGAGQAGGVGFRGGTGGSGLVIVRYAV